MVLRRYTTNKGTRRHISGRGWWFFCGLGLLLATSCGSGQLQQEFSLAQKHLAAGDYNQAFKSFQGIATRYPPGEVVAEALFWAGNINCLYLDKPKEALEEFEEFLLYYPHHRRAQQVRFQTAKIYEEVLDNLQGAILKYQQVVDFGRDRKLAAQSQLRIVSCYQRLGELDQALVEARTLLRNYSRGQYADDAQLIIAEIYAARKNYPQAHAAYDELIRKYPGSELVGEARLGKANCWEEQGEYLKALAVYKKLQRSYTNTELVKRKLAYLKQKIQHEEQLGKKGRKIKR